MSEQDPPSKPAASNRQAGIDITPRDGAESGKIATGSRRQDMHYEPDPDQLVVARSMVPPAGPLPPEEQSGAFDHDELKGDIARPDVRVDPSAASVWDARPPADDAEKSGNPTGH